MAEFNILETLDLGGRDKTKEEKRKILTDRDKFATWEMMQLHYHPDVKWHLPHGKPPVQAGLAFQKQYYDMHYDIETTAKQWTMMLETIKNNIEKTKEKKS